MGHPASGDGEIVAFATADLGIEHSQQLGSEGGVAAGIEGDFVGIDHPVEVAPDFAAEDAVRAVFRGKSAQGFQAAKEHGHVGVVFVGGVVEVNHPGAAAVEDGGEIGLHAGVAGRFDVGTGVGELELDGVAAELGGFALLFAADGLHLFVVELQKRAGARGAGAIGHDDASEGFAGVVEAVGDAGMRHNLDVVLVGRDAEVGDTGEGGGGQFVAFRQKHVGIGAGELHGVGKSRAGYSPVATSEASAACTRGLSSR